MEKTILGRDGFAELAIEEVLKILPDGDYESSIQDIAKASGPYKAIIIKKKGTFVSPTINIDAFYADYRDGKCLQEIFTEMADIVQMPIPTALPTNFDIMLRDFEAVKDKLAVRLFKTSKVEDMPHREMVDGISAVPYIIISNNKGGIMSTRVNTDLLDFWGKEEHEVIDEAFENNKRLFPCKIKTSSAYGVAEAGMVVITTENISNGAACIFYDGVLEEVSKIVGDRFFLLPSSVNEFITAPYSEDVDPAFLLALVREVNGTLHEDEMLIDAVYSYMDGELRREA